MTANVNGVKDNSFHLVRTLVVPNDVVYVQENRLRDTSHEQRLAFHVLAHSSYILFTLICVQRSTCPRGHARSGVATLLSSRFPGALSARVLDEYTVPGRYLVVATDFADRLVIICNVYAPCETAEKASFFAALAARTYSSNALHMTLGGINLAADLVVDSASGERRDTSERASFWRW